MTDFILLEDCYVSLIKLGIFLNPHLAGLRVFLKSLQIDEGWYFTPQGLLVFALIPA
jgi:hypothetical protein